MILGPSRQEEHPCSCHARSLANCAGEIRIDGAEAFDRDELGPQIGYLPQDIELFDGTVTDNIARFGDVDAESG